MGVPSFFRWLSRKYPKIICPVLEEYPQVVDGVALPIDYASPNPNGELDNLYLDMNGIVHPCSHPENKPPPETEDEMLLAVFEYTNRVLNMARPRKVLLMAVDGVAPRAKMNQQRARRFRSARDAQIANEAREEELRERENYGEIIDDALKKKKTWDSNAITPGTPFMDKLAAALRYWTAFKLATDPGWKNLQVIISDATVPGEGEHKIMNFIRSQRADPEYNPNTTHCIYGLDADLIFLGLATHEPHFKILREDVFAQDNRKRTTFSDNMSEEEKELIMKKDAEKPFLWLHISVLREYLAAELWIPRLSFNFDLERAIDDWVFMCFFCGNDFLPHLPSLDVRENSIDILLDIWKVILPSLKTYMTCDGFLNLESVEILLKQLGDREPDIFKTRYIQEVRKQEAFERRRLQNGKNISKGQDRHPTIPNEQLQLYDTSGKLAAGSWNLTTSDMVRLKKEIMLANEGDPDAIAIVRAQSDKNNELVKNITEEEMEKVVDEANKRNFKVAELMKKKLSARKHKLEEEEQNADKDVEEDKENPMKKVKTEDENLTNEIKSEVEAAVQEEEDDNDDESSEESDVKNNIVKKSAGSIISSGDITSGVIDTDDNVKLYESGYRERYYTEKFHISKDEIEIVRRDMVRSYVEGVSWVLRYYYQGCASWNWYYPFHYAPFASDFFDIKDIKVEFDLGEPFLPYEQLMSVLPAASGHTLPPIFRPLMSEADSPIIDFYPPEFPIDMNGKKMSWQGIALLPFIDEKRLLEVVRAQYPKLSDAERSRNVRKEAILLISNKNVNYEKFSKKLYQSEDLADDFEIKFRHFKSGLSGIVSIDEEGFKLNSKLLCPLESTSLPELSTNLFLKALFKFTPLPANNKSVILNGYIPAEATLSVYDVDSILYKYGGNNFQRNNRFFGNDMKKNVVKVGPSGTTQYKPREGGYRSFFYFSNAKNANNTNRNGSYNNVHQQRGQQTNYRGARDSGGSYNNGYIKNNYNNQQGRRYNNNSHQNYNNNSDYNRGGYSGQSRYNNNGNYQNSRYQGGNEGYRRF
ncbi:hypothetical protein KAFR_0C06110 [Kazachstania africana CBS 2517]|uniref:5'-3' exoribonuclease n=1 Tax=Kazachstania africana (strain ATCC 22294 / BCRC 22015 / CBS 2517 / CECT 1963 / NBRC 1671 / NRRL Y-8276) TaxID=1071382 RepID=H2ATA3_KAZAF|nr:hypothetical protein KAFR_0C06110 [Kazachstania africana CBS 2517]CCF57603.1 hypothetical protein KAFR_0C06110 [Kazachstania africana CBS 2517]